MNTVGSARARAQIVSALEAASLFRIAEVVTAPVRIPVGRRNLRRFYSQFVSPGDLAYDIGANVGEHTAALLALGARVVSVEPQRACVEKLRARFGDRVTVVPYAVAAEAGERVLLLNRLSDERATLSQHHVEHGRFRRGWEGTEDVQAIPLDALTAEYGLPDLCKIDVEALEREVLEGLSEPIPLVIFEYHEGFAGTNECISLLDELAPYRFNYRVGRSPQLAREDWTSGAEVYARLTAIGVPIYGDVVARLEQPGSV